MCGHLPPQQQTQLTLTVREPSGAEGSHTVLLCPPCLDLLDARLRIPAPHYAANDSLAQLMDEIRRARIERARWPGPEKVPA